jgi:TetR/AcrR family transcriptional repressor of uid operon
VANTVARFCDCYRVELRRLACIANPTLEEDGVEAAEELLLACLFGLAHRSLSKPRLPARQTAVLVTRMMLAAVRG